ncbi:MAG TPA: class I SAM-dependent methyltransferase [Acetobacteraceae bacterium]|jgi:SAM-dependent methyltransferase|nr:class I SAM-dependent methyltransferase [Acetobacteraceae bacterium]
MNGPSQASLPEIDQPERPKGASPWLCLTCGGAYGPSRISGLLRCRACGFMTADVRLGDGALAALYGRDYFHGEEYHDYLAEEESLRANFARRIVTLRQHVPNLAEAVLFEIGCAYGFFLEEVKDVVHQTSGIDISADAVRHAVELLGVNAICGDYLRTDIGRRPDLIVMWDTIEHLARPDLFLAKAARDLRPGGYIAITTGDIGSPFARFRGGRWRMIHPPTHLHYFSASTLRLVLERTGFEVVHLSHPGVTRNVLSSLYIIFALKMGTPALFELVRRLRILDFSVTLNLFDIMFVIARTHGTNAPVPQSPCR